MKRTLKKKIRLIIVLSIILVLNILAIYAFGRNQYNIVLVGNEVIIQNVGDPYIDPGIATTNGKQEEIINPEEYKIDSNVDYETVGTYDVTYTISFKGKEYELTRQVAVVDTVNPVIESNLETIQKDYCTKKDVEKLTYTATDNYDGDLTDQIEVIETDENVTLKVSDSSGNRQELIIPIKYNVEPSPYLSLNGKEKISIPLNGTYQESGAKYVDGCGNLIDNNVEISGNVDTSKAGVYQIKYTHPKTTKALTRTVTVYEPQVVDNSNKTIYLTFDDGPGYYTTSVLDTLAKHNVKATFFVTNQFSNYMYLLEREHNEGHTIAVHTYTHNYQTVYSSYEGYLDDFNKMNDVIESYTGTRSNLFRFPGGSSNTVSTKYSKGIVSTIASNMTELGYVYFDWNVSSGDASNATSSQIYSNVVNGVARCNECVVLMHDIKKTTANALDDMLTTLQAKGYTFATLTVDSPTCHQRIAN